MLRLDFKVTRMKPLTIHSIASYKDCFVIHPTNDFCIYAIGSHIVIKSLLVDHSYQYLKVNNSKSINYIISNSIMNIL